ncbi:MAG: hypothetical protein LH631_09075 [Alkalinema sp. CAN_BIN05]|nr:hypothetical protein [Alkalinema sp. CAN_BIN05]
MTIAVTIHLPDDLYQRAERFARLSNRDLASVITDTVQSLLPPMGNYIDTLQPIETLSNQEILILANSKMTPDEDSRMSFLLAHQRENELIEGEAQELQALMQIYQEGWLRQTTALIQAIERGLMEPMDS